MNSNTLPESHCQHYYVRDEDGHPFACVAITPMSLSDNTRLCRGISICSDDDQWEFKEARKRAVNRLRHAWHSHGNSAPMLNTRINVVSDFYDGYDHVFTLEGPQEAIMKSAFNTESTEKESKILDFLIKRIQESGEEHANTRSDSDASTDCSAPVGGGGVSVPVDAVSEPGS